MNRQIFSLIVMIALTASVLLTSCKKDDEEGYTVSGIIPTGNWSEVSVSFDLGNTWHATTSVSNLKTFKLKMPIPKSELKSLSDGLQDMIKGAYKSESDKLPPLFETIIDSKLSSFLDKIALNNENSFASIATFYARNNDQKETLSLFKLPAVVQFMYIDSDEINLSGDIDETIPPVEGTTDNPTPVKLAYNMQLKKGWNTVVVGINLSAAISGAVDMSIRTEPIKTDIKTVWVTVGN